MSGWEDAPESAAKTNEDWENATVAPIKQPQPSALGVGEAAAAAAAVPKAGWDIKKAIFTPPGAAPAQDIPGMQRYLDSQIRALGVKGTIPLNKFAEAMNIPVDAVSPSVLQDALKEMKGTPPQRVPVQTPSGGTIYKTVPGKPPINLAHLAEQSMMERHAPRVAEALRPIAGPLTTAAKYIAGPLAVGAVAGEGQDAANRFANEDYLGGTISGLGAFGSGVAALPFVPPPFRVIGGAVGAAAPFVNMGIDYLRKPSKPGYADGGGVNNDQLMQMIRASRTARANNMQSRPGKYLTSESPNLRFVDQFADRNTTGEFIPSTRSMSLLRNPTGLNQDDMMTAAHEYQHFKDELAKNNPLNIRPEDSAMQDAIRAKINAYRDKPINLQTMPVDFDARSGLTGQQKPSEQLSQLAGYEAGLPAGMNITQSGLGQTLTPQQKAMVLRRMNPLPQGVDAMVGGYATGGLASIK